MFLARGSRSTRPAPAPAPFAPAPLLRQYCLLAVFPGLYVLFALAPSRKAEQQPYLARRFLRVLPARPRLNIHLALSEGLVGATHILGTAAARCAVLATVYL